MDKRKIKKLQNMGVEESLILDVEAPLACLPSHLYKNGRDALGMLLKCKDTQTTNKIREVLENIPIEKVTRPASVNVNPILYGCDKGWNEALEDVEQWRDNKLKELDK